MLKTILTTAFLSVFCAGAFAQVSPIYTAGAHYKVSGNRDLIARILNDQYSSKQALRRDHDKTTAGTTAARLKSFCGYNLADTATMLSTGRSDSGYFVYSGERGSAFNFQTLSFDVNPVIASTSPVNENYSLTYNIADDFPISSGATEIFPDSAYLWYTNPAAGADSFSYGAVVSYLYNTSSVNEQDNQFQPGLPGQLQRCKYIYSSGSLAATIFFNYNSSTGLWDTTNIICHTYNGLGQLAIDSSSFNYGAGLWIVDYKYVYTYDAAGNVTAVDNFVDSSGYWQQHREIALTFNADNTLKTAGVSQYSGGTWTPVSVDSFGYTSGVSYFTFEKTSLYAYDTNFCTYLKHVSPLGLPDTLYYNYYISGPGLPSQLQNEKKVVFVYNSYDNPVTATAYNFHITDSATWSGSFNTAPERIFYYHYETYEITDVHNIAGVAPTLNIYPNPANDEVKISYPGAKKGAYYSVSLTNAAGQLVSAERIPWLKELETISVKELIDGLYILEVRDDENVILSQQKIIKR